LSPRVLHLRHPCLLDEPRDLFPTSGVALGYVGAAAECQNVLLFVSVDSGNGFTQRTPLWSETGPDGRRQGGRRRAGLAVFHGVAPASWDATSHDGTHTVRHHTGRVPTK